MSAVTIVVRAARAQDAAALADLSTQLGYPATPEAITRRLAQIHTRGAGAVLIAADASGRVLGWTHVVTRVSLEQDAHAELAGLVVDASARCAGIGTQLLAAAEQWTRAQGFDLMRVRSNVVRERAHGFYRRAGYVERKRQVVFEKSLG